MLNRLGWPVRVIVFAVAIGGIGAPVSSFFEPGLSVPLPAAIAVRPLAAAAGTREVILPPGPVAAEQRLQRRQMRLEGVRG